MIYIYIPEYQNHSVSLRDCSDCHPQYHDFNPTAPHYYILYITTSIIRYSPCREEHGINMTSDKGNVDQAPQSGGAKDTTDVPTCAFWDEELAIWSTEGVSTLPSTTPGKALLVMVCAGLTS